MPPADLSFGAAHVRDAIAACDLLRHFSGLTAAKWQQRPDPAGLLACYGTFAGLLAEFGPSETAILQALELDMLADPAWWTRLVLVAAQPEPAPALLTEMAALNLRLAFLLSTLPKLFNPSVPSASDPSAAAPAEDLPTLTVRLGSRYGQASHPRRLSWAIEAISLLWEAVGETTGEPAPLTLAAYIPAPSAVLVFQGPTAVMGPLKKLLNALWEQVVSHHALNAQQRAEQIPQVVARAHPLENTLPDLVEATRAVMEQGLRLFLQTGASTAEMDDPARFTPERLLSASDSLLVASGGQRAGQNGPTVTGEPEADAQGDELDALIAEERDYLRKESQRKKAMERAPRSWVSKRPSE